jgi:hypothetical protein
VADQAVQYAHLRPLQRCRICHAPASEAVYTGLNELVAVYCSRHAQKGLAAFKEGRTI